MKELHADVVVVGGGPCGTTAATLLRRAGHEVVLLERAHHPRHQVGESLLPSTIHGVCRLLGVWDEVHDAGFVRKRGGTFRWGRDAEPWTFAFAAGHLGEADYAFQVERARFDALLFENAKRCGVETHEGVEAMELVMNGDRAHGVAAIDGGRRRVVVRAPYVVDASGHASRIARAVGRRTYSGSLQNVAVYGYYEGASRQPPPNAGNIITSAFNDGWCWFIPLTPNLTSVGAVVDRRHAGRIRGDHESALAWFVRQCPIVNDHLRDAHRITEGMYGEVRIRKDWSYTTERLCAPGVLLAGDAACFVDPVFSSGVHLATYSGVLAARTVATALSGELDEALCMQEFERRYRREFSLFYDFVLAFYDMNQDWSSYYWTARSLLGTEERASEAFIRLVAGGASAPADFFRERKGFGRSFSEMVETIADRPSGTPGSLPARLSETDGPDAARLMHARSQEGKQLIVGGDGEGPLFEGGLVPSPDGLRWAHAGAASTPGASETHARRSDSGVGP